MTVHHKHLRGSAGASITKAVVRFCRVQMCSVAQYWSKQHQTGPGSQA